MHAQLSLYFLAPLMRVLLFLAWFMERALTFYQQGNKNGLDARRISAWREIYFLDANKKNATRGDRQSGKFISPPP